MNELEAHKRLVELHFSFFISAGLHVVTMLNVADHLASGITDSDEIAEKEGVDADQLYRIMRMLSGYGLFQSDGGRHFSPTEMSKLLQSDHASPFSPFIEMNSHYGFQSIVEMLPAVRNGEIAFERKYGKATFAYICEKPERVSLVQRAYQGMRWPETDAVLDAIDLSDTAVFADIGGGHGDAAIAFLKRYENSRAIVFDLPEVVSQTREKIKDLQLEGRCQYIGGDFFSSVPSDADTYFLRHILHDWDDESCITILGNIKQCAKPGSRVMIAEALVADATRPDIAKMYDMEMMLFLHGRERSTEEFEVLISKAELDFAGTNSTNSIISVIEAVVP